MAHPPSPPPPPLTLIIRFTPPLPDLRLSIASPPTTTPPTLATLIRPHLPPPLSTCPLRLIHAGALLPPTLPLSTSLRLASSPPLRPLYLHCSIPPQTHLTPFELAAEKSAAASLSLAAPPQTPPPQPQQQHHPHQPQGFDRLLAAGLTPPEIAVLRSQFLALHAHAHTPDTMPTPPELRVLEEAWLDEGSAPGEAAAAGEAGALEDLLWGNVVGFFWGVGAVLWLVREEGVWSRRRRVGVVTGWLVNVAFCVMRVGG